MKPEDVTDEMLDAAQAVADQASLFGDPWGAKRAVLAAAINAMPQTDAQAQIDALKSENTAITAARDLALASLNKQDAEIDALNTSVRMANEQAEKFEREWYLRGDELDAANARLHEVATFCATVEQERDALKAERDALRKALAEFVHYADDCDDDSPELDRARAALAKEPT
jgi:chromosome segregation ATPase